MLSVEGPRASMLPHQCLETAFVKTPSIYHFYTSLPQVTLTVYKAPKGLHLPCSLVSNTGYQWPTQINQRRCGALFLCLHEVDSHNSGILIASYAVSCSTPIYNVERDKVARLPYSWRCRKLASREVSGKRLRR